MHESIVYLVHVIMFGVDGEWIIEERFRFHDALSLSPFFFFSFFSVFCFLFYFPHVKLWITMATSSSFLLCSSCRHSYPSSSFEEASFGVKPRDAFQKVQSIVGMINGKTPEDIHHLHNLSAALQDLCGRMHEEVQMLKDKLEASEEKVLKKEAALGEANSKVLRATVQSAKAILTPGGMGSAGSTTNSAIGGSTALAPPLPTYNPHLANKNPFSGVPEYNLKRMTTALELVSASIYSLLESLAIHARVDTALLWIRPKNLISNELIAPFVVGRDMSKLMNSAPYRVAETSIPCAVNVTGIAVNLKPHPGVLDTRRSEDIPLSELIEQSNAAQLLVPVSSRYGDQVLAVIHLIGSPRYPFPFSRRNEEAAKYAATFFSVILSSHHETMANEWSNHFYDPSMAQCTSTYRGELDLRGDEKCVDDFAPPPMLVYRSLNPSLPQVARGGGGAAGAGAGATTGASSGAAAPPRSGGHHMGTISTNPGGGPTDPREAFMNLKVAMTKKAVPMNPVPSVKDLHLHAMNMENNWVGAVRALSELETYVNTYRNGKMREEVERLREERERAREDAERNALKYSWRHMPQKSTNNLNESKVGNEIEMKRRGTNNGESVGRASSINAVKGILHGGGGNSGAKASSLSISLAKRGSIRQQSIKFPPLKPSTSTSPTYGTARRRSTASVHFWGSEERRARKGTGSKSSRRSSSSTTASHEGGRKRSGSTAGDGSSVRSSRSSSINSVDLALELSPAIIAKDDALDPSDVLKPEELMDVEALALKQLRYLGVDTTPFTRSPPVVQDVRQLNLF